jgi:tetratricopeptide (TPR) repeat protein
MNDQINSLNDQATFAGKQGRYAEALELFRQSLSLNPFDFDALSGTAIALSQLGQYDQALDHFDRAAAVRSDDFRVHHHRGLILNLLKRWREAADSFDRALSLQNDHPDAHLNRGTALQNQDRFAEALADYEHAVVLRPDFMQAHFQRGNVLQDMGRDAEALASYERALAIEGHFPQLHYNHGVVLQKLGRRHEALASYNRAVSLRPDYARALHTKALLLLQLGNYEEGWPLHEWRWRDEGSMQQWEKKLPQPLWLGTQPLAGKTILLHVEQGYGDIIQFIRYVPLVHAQGAAVILETPPLMLSLLRSLKGSYTFIRPGDPYPPFDFHCPLMSLPLAFKTTLKTIPADIPYLRADPQKAQHWAQRLQDYRGLKVGLVWAGGQRPQAAATAIDAHRSLHLSAFAPLAGIPDVHFFSLQKGERASQLAELRDANWSGPEIIDYMDEIKDWGDTAALLQNLDLVVSCDTSAAHLAGAMGKPVWILNRYDSCWRWLLDREDSPWYPMARLFRQERPGDWAGVVGQMRKSLSVMASDCNRPHAK